VTDPAEQGRRWARSLPNCYWQKLKKAAVSIELWGKGPRCQRQRRGGADRAGELYEREKRWEELAAVLDKQAMLSTSDPAKRGRHPAQAGHGVHRRSCRSPTWRWPRGKTLLDAEPENRRAQDALRKLYFADKDWDALEGFYSVQGKWDEFARVLERQAETETGEARVGLWNKIAVSLPRRSQQAGQGAEGIREDALVHTSMATTWWSAEALIRCTRERQGRQAPGRGFCRCNSNTPRTRAERQERMLRYRADSLVEGGTGGRQAAGAHGGPAGAIREIRAEEWCARIRRAGLAGETANSGSAGWKPTRRVLPSLQGQDATSPFWATVARAYEKELANTEAGHRAQPGDSRDRGSRRAGRIGSRTPVCGHRPARPVVGLYDKKLALAGSEDEKREVRLQLAALYEEQVHDADKASRALQGHPEDGKGRRAGAARHSTALYRAHRRWKGSEQDHRTPAQAAQ